ncbi:MAG: tripartite tricarboxylate transporter substrate binding protein [Burkholderiaceae bacterium]
MKRLTLGMGMLLAALPLSMAAAADAPAAYPEKPITIVVPYPPGGSTDALGRLLGEKIGAALGQTVIVENKAGASGNIGAVAVKNSKADGYTLFLGTSTALSVNQSLYPDMPYNPQKDFEPIILASFLPSLVVVPSSLPVKTLPELTAYLKKQGGKANYASSSNGTPAHLGGELYKRMANVEATHVPYKGGAPALVDLVAGRTNYMFAILPESMPMVKSGQLRALAVTTAKRLSAYPDIPTVAESIPGYELLGWYGFLAPKGTPKPIIKKLNEAFNQALEDPQTKKRLSTMGFEIAGGPPERLGDMMRTESVKWKKVIDEAGIKLN